MAVLKYIEACGLAEHAHRRLGTSGGRPVDPISLLLGPNAERRTALARELPELFGAEPTLEPLPVTMRTLRSAMEALEDPSLSACWADDLTPGWVFQALNDPAREQLDEKINRGGKIGLHEVARKTQMFTDRYLINWTLQNSLGPLWLSICSKNGWTPDVVASGTLDRLNIRRSEWRSHRAAGRVSPTAMMPLRTVLEHTWSDFIPPPAIGNADALTPSSIRELKVIDPAVGTGHFLLVAFDLLVVLYREEARHRGRVGAAPWTPRAIVERILSHNLHGVDLDPAAVRLATTMLKIKALQVAPEAESTRVHLMATDRHTLWGRGPTVEAPARAHERLRPDSSRPEPSSVELALERAPELGSLLQVDEALARPDAVVVGSTSDREALLAGDRSPAPVRLLRLLRTRQYDLVVTNPPYQGTKRLKQSDLVAAIYPEGSADLYAAFLLRGLQLVREGGISAQVTMRSWLFTKQFSQLRERLLSGHQLMAIGDFEHGAFEQLGGMVVSVCASVFRRDRRSTTAVALRPSRNAAQRGSSRTAEKRAATRCQTGLLTFDPERLRAIAEWPLVYWWTEQDLERYTHSPKLAEVCDVRQGMATGDNRRFLRRPWELPADGVWCVPIDHAERPGLAAQWVPYVKGAAGKTWFEPLDHVVRWGCGGLEIKTYTRHGRQASRPQNERFYFQPGVCYSTIGARFSARLRLYRSVFDVSGSSVFADDPEQLCCMLNRSAVGDVMSALNPTVNFQVGDLKRVPLISVHASSQIVATLKRAFTIRESHRETSVTFERPGPSPWRHALKWARQAVDRPSGAPLPPYVEHRDPEPPADHLSFAFGQALGRFKSTDANSDAVLPHGLFLLDRTGCMTHAGDDLDHPACAALHRAWARHRETLPTERGSLRDFLALEFFSKVHEPMYERRPIYWPLSSTRRTFVAWIHIHRFDTHTFPTLLRRLHHTQTRLESATLAPTGDQTATAARVSRVHAELTGFIDLIEQCAHRGPPPTSPDPSHCPPRARDHRFELHLDDGVCINSATLWPLLAPQWKAPRAWWTELACAAARTRRDWSHAARRYWPSRVEEQCAAEPSLSVRHGCFWRYHPARAWACELRLQADFGGEVRIEESAHTHADGSTSPDHTVLRAAYLAAHPEEALAAVEREAHRRMGQGRRRVPVHELHVYEAGLGSAVPEAVRRLEARVSERQGAPFRLCTPEGATRAQPDGLARPSGGDAP